VCPTEIVKICLLVKSRKYKTNFALVLNNMFKDENVKLLHFLGHPSQTIKAKLAWQGPK